MIKPLIRWVVGPCQPIGYQILRHSVNKFKSIYDDTFDLMICYNQIDKPNFVFDFNVEYYDQTSTDQDFRVIKNDAWSGTGWKLCPPRLRKESHEIIIDNDVVIRDKIGLIDEFLNSDHLLGFNAYHRAYGRFNIDDKLFLNSGFVGLPPDFDYKHQLDMIYDGKPIYRFDEQGMVAAVFAANRHKLIGFDQMSPLDETTTFNNCKIAHFIHANSTNKHHLAWSTYKKITKL